jgi:hypothetical protein
MLAELGKHASPEELSKLVTMDTDAAGIDRTAVAACPHLVLIDAEHTNVAAFSDFLSILPLVADDSMITFHDANLVGDTIQIIERFLTYMRTPYSMVILPSCVAVFGFGAFLKPVQTELAPHAEDNQRYFADARQQRQEAVADAVIARTAGLPARRQRGSVRREYAGSAGRLHQFNIVATDRPDTRGGTAGATPPWAMRHMPSQ